MNSVSNLAKAISDGKLVLTTQLSFTPDVKVGHIREKARLFKDFTAVFAGEENTTDMNISSLALAMILKEEGIEPVLQINSRDKNRIAIQKEIITASILGINNICALVGIHPASKKGLGSKAVYDLDPLNIVSSMKMLKDEGRLIDGEHINVQPNLFIGIEDNPQGEPFEAMPLFLEKKLNAGADFVLTQPIFNVDRFKEFLEKYKSKSSDYNLKLILTVYPLKSFEDIDNLKKHYPGINIPPSIQDPFKNASNPEQEGKKIAIGIINDLKNLDGVKGFNIIAPSREDIVLELAKTIL